MTTRKKTAQPFSGVTQVAGRRRSQHARPSAFSMQRARDLLEQRPAAIARPCDCASSLRTASLLQPSDQAITRASFKQAIATSDLDPQASDFINQQASQ
ncbi:UNVERIFIED_CONTAM: hypothetical protein Sradi_3794500 [Sesamum radiatum]|uniref:Uncharacterized protein n=1 Tax=Sesamum radiatum TaxID=300843 RepID=A0AAW2PZU1_SESRA